MKRTIFLITAVILVLAIAAAVCLLPWPAQFDITFRGAKVTADGTVFRGM